VPSCRWPLCPACLPGCLCAYHDCVRACVSVSCVGVCRVTCVVRVCVRCVALSPSVVCKTHLMNSTCTVLEVHVVVQARCYAPVLVEGGARAVSALGARILDAYCVRRFSIATCTPSHAEAGGCVTSCTRKARAQQLARVARTPWQSTAGHPLTVDPDSWATIPRALASARLCDTAQVRTHALS
jgi:hypothetical protein